MSKRKKLPGRFCWCCEMRRPNETFSRKRSVCSRCALLGKEEIAYRQHVRNIDRLLTFDGFVRKHQEKTFARYLGHQDPRVRAYAEEVQAAIEKARRLPSLMCFVDDETPEAIQAALDDEADSDREEAGWITYEGEPAAY